MAAEKVVTRARAALPRSAGVPDAGAIGDKIKIGICTFQLKRGKGPPDGRFAFVTTAGRGGTEGLAGTLDCPMLFGSGAEVAFAGISLTEMLERLEAKIARLANAKEVLFLGKSGGGYSAAALGAAYAAMHPSKRVRVVAFNPPTVLWPPDEGRKGKVYFKILERIKRGDPSMLKRLETEADLRFLVQRALDKKADFGLTIIAGERNPRDLRHAERLDDLDGIRLIFCDTNQHKIHWWLDVPLDDPEGMARAIHKWRTAKQEGGDAEPDDLDEMDDTGSDRSEPDEEMIAAIRAFREVAPDLESLFAWNPSEGGDSADLPAHAMVDTDR